ncbi:MAG: sialidase family protein [Betaproteobacteria bacterium]
MRRLLAVLLLTSPLATAHDAHKHVHHGPPKAPAGFASLDVYRDRDQIHVLSGEQAGERMALWHRRSVDGKTWTGPTRVDRPGAEPSGVRPNNDAQIAALGNEVVAVWPVAGTGWGGSGPLASALSSDGGKTWRAGPNPSETGLTTGHGFVDLLFDGKGLHAVWLDGRDKAQGLRYARSTDAGRTWLPSMTIAVATCECCWNSLLSVDGAIHVLYRGKDPRDMQMAVADGGGWKRRGAVGAFNWQVKGCPETGGALVSAAGQMHALAWTGSDRHIGLHVLASADRGLTWTDPVRIGGRDARHADLAVAEDGTLAAVWDEGDRVWFARSRDTGKTWAKPEQVSASGAEGTFPRIIPAGRGPILLWGERSAGGRRELRSAVRP